MLIQVSKWITETDKATRKECTSGTRGISTGNEMEAIGEYSKCGYFVAISNWYQKKKSTQSKMFLLFYMENFWKWIFGSIQRGKFYPQLSYLIKVNTPRAVMQETKKAFRKLPNLEQALTALSNLKGVGITMASALLAAAAPDSAPFMADECKWWCFVVESATIFNRWIYSNESN